MIARKGRVGRGVDKSVEWKCAASNLHAFIHVPPPSPPLVLQQPPLCCPLAAVGRGGERAPKVRHPTSRARRESFRGGRRGVLVSVMPSPAKPPSTLSSDVEEGGGGENFWLSPQRTGRRRGSSGLWRRAAMLNGPRTLVVVLGMRRGESFFILASRQALHLTYIRSNCMRCT